MKMLNICIQTQKHMFLQTRIPYKLKTRSHDTYSKTYMGGRQLQLNITGQWTSKYSFAFALCWSFPAGYGTTFLSFCFPSEACIEKTIFFSSGYQLEIVYRLGMGAHVHFPFYSRTLSAHELYKLPQSLWVHGLCCA